MKFDSQYVTKDYPDDSNNPAFKKGKEIHKQLEDYIVSHKDGKPDSSILGKYSVTAKPIIDAYVKYIGAESIVPENQIALNDDWEKVSWFDKEVKFRAIYDVIIRVSDTLIHLIDWKSGKFREYDTDYGQLHLSATMIFAINPEVMEIISFYKYVEHSKTVKVTFKRDELYDDLKEHFEKEYQEVQAAGKVDSFPAKKNKYCFFCKHPDCEFTP